MSRRPLVIERNSTLHRGLIGAGIVVGIALIAWGSGLAPFSQAQATRVMIYAVAIAGLNIATGYVGMLSVGHSAFFGLGAYTTGILVVHEGWGAWATIPAAFVVCLIAGLVVGVPALRIRGLYLAMVTLAFAVAFPEIIGRFENLTGGASGMTIRRVDLRPPAWTGFTLGEKSQWLYWVSVAVLVLTIYLTASLTHSRYGLAMAAVREHEIAASASGVNIAVLKTVSFGLSGAITGVAGSLFAMYMGSLYAEGSFTLLAGISLLIGLVLGGERTILGPIVGGVAVVYIPYVTSSLGVGQAAAVLFAVILIFLIFVAPAGIIGGLDKLARRFVVVQATRPEQGLGCLPRAESEAIPLPEPSSAPTERQSS